jgi:hypothetical protein
MLAMFLGRLEFFTIVIGVLKLLHDGSDIISASLQARSTKPAVTHADGGVDRHRDRQHQDVECSTISAQAAGAGDEGAISVEP